jgi:hypothetical protein
MTKFTKHDYQVVTKKGSYISEEDQHKITEKAQSKFLSIAGRSLHYYSGENLTPIKNQKQFNTLFESFMLEHFPNIPAKEFNLEKGRMEWGIDVNALYHLLEAKNNYGSVEYKSDLFAKEPYIQIDEYLDKIIIYSNKLIIAKPSRQIEKKDIDVIVEDYKKHFPHFEEFLKLAINLRFAGDRKASFLLFRVPTNWGKSFLSAVMAEVNTGIEVEYSRLINTSVSDINPLSIRNSFILFMDEFKAFGASMKRLTHSITLAPKYQLATTEELYLKVLMSDEKSESFTDIVDDQIKNRIINWDFYHEYKKIGELGHREIFRKYGANNYRIALAHYVHDFLKREANILLSKGEMMASKEADDFVVDALSRARLEEKSATEGTKDALIDGVMEVLQNREDYPAIEKNIFEIQGGKNDGLIFVKSPKKTFTELIKMMNTEGAFKKMRYKLTDIASLIPIVQDCTQRPVKVNGKIAKGFIISNPVFEVEEDGKNFKATTKGLIRDV